MVAKAALLDRVVEGLRASGARVLVSDSRHPFRLVVRQGGDEVAARVYVWNLSGGGGQRRPEWERRIEITRLEWEADEQALVLGYDEDLDVFVAFDPEYHKDPGSSGSASVQVPLNALELAQLHGIRSHRRKNDEVAIALRPNMLGPYLQWQQVIHDELVVDDSLLQELENTAEAGGDEVSSSAALPGSKGLPARQKVMRSIQQTLRDQTFRGRVLAAYEDRCALCDVQLRLVEAAHIVPVREKGSTDETCNGVALCSLHHAAFDRGVVGINPDFSVMVNEEHLANLQSEGLAGGMEGFRHGLRTSMRLPTDPAQRPTPELLARGLEIRGWPIK